MTSGERRLLLVFMAQHRPQFPLADLTIYMYSTVSEHPLTPMLRDIKEILLAGQQAQKTEMSKMRTSLCNMQDELAKLQKLVKEESEKGFSIEDSVFKVPF